MSSEIYEEAYRSKVQGFPGKAKLLGVSRDLR